jgi:hypothetical protein
VTLRKVREFTDPTDARTARQLTRQIAELEENVVSETAAIRSAMLTRFKVKATEATDAEPNFELSPGEAVGFDTTDGNVQVILEAASKENEGKAAAVVKRVLANTVFVRPSGGSLINGTIVLVIAAVGLTVIMSDGENYWA